MKLDKHTVVWVLGIVFVTAGFLLLFTQRQFQRMDEVVDRIEQEQVQLAIGRNSPQAITQLRQEVEALIERVGDHEAKIPNQANLGAFLEELARFAETQRIVQDAVEPGEAEEVNGIIALPISLRVRGPFQSVYAFIQDIEHMQRITQVQRFASSVDKNRPGDVYAELKLRVFYRAS